MREEKLCPCFCNGVGRGSGKGVRSQQQVQPNFYPPSPNRQKLLLPYFLTYTHPPIPGVESGWQEMRVVFKNIRDLGECGRRTSELSWLWLCNGLFHSNAEAALGRETVWVENLLLGLAKSLSRGRPGWMLLPSKQGVGGVGGL